MTRTKKQSTEAAVSPPTTLREAIRRDAHIEKDFVFQ